MSVGGSRGCPGLSESVGPCGDGSADGLSIDSNASVRTAVAGCHEAAAPLKQHKSRDADWLKNISSSKRSELLECELKKMTTVIASECTAL